MTYAFPNSDGALINFKSRYENFIGGEWVKPVKGNYFENITPVLGKPFCEVARSTSEDIELALDAAHKAKKGWAMTSVGDRAAILNKIAFYRVFLLQLVDQLVKGHLRLLFLDFRFYFTCVAPLM